MRTLMNDSQRNLTVVENGELRRYELLVAGTTVGTLDFRVLGQRRVLGHTEVIADHRGRGLATALIKAVSTTSSRRKSGSRITALRLSGSSRAIRST